MAQNQPQHIMDAGGGQGGSPAAHSPPVASSTPPLMSGNVPGASRAPSAGLSFGTDLGHLLCDSSSGWSSSTTSPSIPRNFIHGQTTVGHHTIPPQMPVHQHPPQQQNSLFIDKIISYLPTNLGDNPADGFNLLQSLYNLSLDQQQHLLLVLQQQWLDNQQQQQLQQPTHSSMGLVVDPSLQRACNMPSSLHNIDAADVVLPSHRSFSVSQDTFQSGLSSSSDVDSIGGPLHRSSSDLDSRINSFHLDLGNLTNNVRANVNDENLIQSVFSHDQQLGQLPMPSNFPPSCASFPHSSCSSGTLLGRTVETVPLTSPPGSLDPGKLLNLNQELAGLYVEDLQRAPGTPLSQTPPPKAVADPNTISFQNGSLNGDADDRTKAPLNNVAHTGSNSSYAATASKSKKNKKSKNVTESHSKKSHQISGNGHPTSEQSDDPPARNDQNAGVAATPQQFSFYSTDQNIFLEKMGSLSSSIVNWISRDKLRPSKAVGEDASDDSAANTAGIPNSSSKGLDGQSASGNSAFVPCNFVNPNTGTAAKKSLNSNKLSYSDVLSSSKAVSDASSKASSSFFHIGPRTKFSDSSASGNAVPLMQNHIVQNPSKKTKNNSVFSSSPSLSVKSKKTSNPFFSSRVGLDEFVYPTMEELASSSRLLDTMNLTSDKKSTSPNTRSKKSDVSANNTEESEEEVAGNAAGQTASKLKSKSTAASSAAGTVLNNNNNKIFNQKQNLKKSSFINNLCESTSSAPSSSSSSVPHTGASEELRDKQGLQQPTSGGTPAAAPEESSSEDDSSQPSASTHPLSPEFPPSPSWPSKNSGGTGNVSCVSLKSRSSFNTNNNNNNVTKGSGGSRNKASSKKRKEQNDWCAVVVGVLQLCWHYILLACKWLYDLVAEVILMSSSLFWHGWTKALSFLRLYGSMCFSALKEVWGYLTDRFDRVWRPRGSKKRLRDAASATHYLEQNIALPSTGDEAMKRLLACRGLNNYNILGVTPQASQEDIRRYYRRQAFLVHPDKNKTPGAEEAFKVLGHAFEEIGEPAKREAYDKRLLGESQLGEAWDKLADLLKELERKLEESANLICCTSCPNKHKRIKVPDRPLYAARYCEQCNIRHGTKEGDIWAESRYYGLKWRYYACMEGAVYDITEWASCQAGNLKQLRANTHTVQYRIVAGKKKGQQQQRGQQQQQQHASDLPTDPEIEEFFNQLYREKFSQHFPSPSSSSPPTSSPSHSATAPPCNSHGGDTGTSGPRRRGDKINRRQRRQ
ncbi:DnaJ domain [Trinorchestia longiramus]|nr:DnaJ domain [Trinorchestia longiramus]